MRTLLHRLLLAVGLSAGAAHAQTGTLAGTIVDAISGETLPGANVLITELSRGAAADLDGNYRIPGVPAGTYTVRYSFAGLDTQEVTGVVVASGETTTLNVQLTSGELETVTVTAEAILELNSEVGLLRQRQRAAAVSDAISAEKISQSGSSDAADAMERVTGASVIGGKYVAIRGLSDRYANTQLNGAQLPTADPDRRSVQFDLFPANLLDNITTLKTFTPDQPGNFSGGLVDISTKSFPGDFSLRFSASGGVNTQTQLGDGFLTYQGGDTDWLGIDDGTRSLPDVVADPDIVIPQERDARRDPELAAQLDAISRAFIRPIDVEEGTAPVNQSYAISLGNEQDVAGGRLGYVISGNYGRSASFYDNGTTGRYTATSQDGQLFLDPELLLSDSRGSVDVTWGGIGNIAFRPNGNHEVSLNTLYTRGGESQARFQVGTLPEIFDEPTDLFINRSIFYIERELASGQLRGRHQFGEAEVTWLGTLSQTSLDEPDLRFFGNTRTGEEGDYRFSTSLADVQLQQRFFRETSESLRGGQGDLEMPFRLFGRRNSVKVGGRYDRTNRDASERRFSIVSNPLAFLTLQPGDDNYGDADAYIEQLGIIGERPNGDPLFGNYIREIRTAPILGNTYDAYLDVAAAYLMTELAPIDRLRVILGARYETTRQSITTASPDATAPGEFTGGRIAVDDILPSLNLVYAVTDRMNVRAAATQTLARPTFLEFAPGCRQAFALAELVCGNPELQRSLISNLDLRWEWFTSPGELLAVSAYGKRIDQPIELAIVNSNGQLAYRNVDQADILGVEVEARQRLAALLPALAEAPVLGNLSLGVNGSIVQSTISIDADELEDRRALNADAADTRPLQGQSPYIVNADVAYEDADNGTNVGLYFNVFGRRLSRVSSLSLPDVYEEPSPVLDFVASQRVLSDWTLKLSVKNLLDSDFLEAYDYTLAGGDSPVYQRYERGRSVSLGLSFNPRFGGGPPPNVPSPSASPAPGL